MALVVGIVWRRVRREGRLGAEERRNRNNDNDYWPQNQNSPAAASEIVRFLIPC